MASGGGIHVSHYTLVCILSLDNSYILANDHLMKNALEVQTSVTSIKFFPPSACFFFHYATEPDLPVWTVTPTLFLVTVAQL